MHVAQQFLKDLHRLIVYFVLRDKNAAVFLTLAERMWQCSWLLVCLIQMRIHRVLDSAERKFC